MHEFNVISNWASLHWPALVSLVGGAAGLSILLETILRKFNVSSKKVAYSLVQLISLLTALVTVYLASLPSKDAAGIYAALTIAAQTWHRFAISPLFSKYLVPFLEYQASTKVSANPAAVDAVPTPTEVELLT